ncbi:MAG: prepilin-type N-terminal cleavage/methylation domain-containing protein, partial [Planctomycetaceae bacterium]|nr:prepilin-type N-terminal cleavage/methylation domain-containing protein [Planctomycetaceae bacterium]
MKRCSPNPHPTNHAGASRGFTLIELLVVMAIIIFLVSITVVVVGAALDNAREAATKATIRKIDGLLTKRMEAFTQAMEKQNSSPQPRYIYNTGLYPSSVNPVGQNISPFVLAAGNVARAKVLGQKALFRAGFPQSITEVVAVDPGLLGGNTNTQSAADSSEAMYIFLTKMESFGLPAVDEDSFSSNEIGDTDGDGLKEFVDGWDQPIRFYRWPTRLIRPSASPGTPESIVSSPPRPPGNPYTITVERDQYFGQVGYGPDLFFGTIPDLQTCSNDPDDPNEALNDSTPPRYYVNNNIRCTWHYRVGTTDY